MKINNNSKYVLYIILFIIFILIRISHLLSSGEIEEISFKSLAISSCAWPFKIIYQTIINDTVLPLYYLIIGILKNEILIKIFNSIVSLVNIYVMILIGKKLLNEKLGVFLGVFLGINHFFLYYTGIISPYCLTFLIQTCVINCLLDYLKRPSKRHFKALNIFNCALILCDTFGFLYVACELFILYILGQKKRIYVGYSAKLLQHAFYAFIIVLPILIIQYALSTKLIIPSNHAGIGLNFNAIYLMLSEYISPFLSFIAPENQTKSTLGMLYSFFLNSDLRNINTLKILITLFYSTILPLIIIVVVSIRAYFRNYKLKLLWLISIMNFAIIVFLMLIEKLDVAPIYTIQFFLTSIILLGYGIFSIKDNLVKGILVVSLITIQVINPEINVFDITIKKNYAITNPINSFIRDYDVTKKDLIFMPYQNKFASLYYKKLNFFDFDYKYLAQTKKNGMISNLSNKKTKTINRKNIHYLMKDYLLQEPTNKYLMKYFFDRVYRKEDMPERFILVIDKGNSKPISKGAIIKCANQNLYSPHPKKLNFKQADLSQNDSELLYNALKSKTLYNFASILNANFKLSEIVEYKKFNNEYYKIDSSSSIYKAINSYDSDYVYLIFNNM
ncbi:MAG: hypothetical protein IJW73_07455 [Candidatus Gastranaerophilales bacterium]|nr:hypothetical protein [Candidatus Gastranaerophilales bacterium]